MILLMDHIRTKRNIPEDVMRCRVVVPSDGRVSVSLWDTTDAAALKQWLDENLGSDCITSVRRSRGVCLCVCAREHLDAHSLRFAAPRTRAASAVAAADVRWAAHPPTHPGAPLNTTGV